MDESINEKTAIPNTTAGNTPKGQRQTGTRKHAHLNSLKTRLFIIACKTIIANGHKTGKCFSKHGWQLLVELLNKNSGHTWTKLQLKNWWDALRQKYRKFEHLINCTGISYNDSTGRICSLVEWWDRKIKEHKDYKEFKDIHYREVAACKVLFGDAFDSDKHAVTPTKACRTGFAEFEDSGYADHLDEIPLDDESSASSDKPNETHFDAAKKDMSGPHSGDKWKTYSRNRKGKAKKVTARDLSSSCDRATSASEMVAAKIANFLGKPVSDQKTIMDELLGTGCLQLWIDFYFWTCTFLSQKRNREMLDNQDDVNLKFALVEWNWQQYQKTQAK